MRKFIYLFSIIAIAACEKPSLTDLAEVSINYTFVERGSMVRSGASTYGEFYDNYLRTKTLTPSTYNLVFINQETGNVTDIRGKWSDREKFKLPTGNYTVIGESRPQIDNCGAPSDTVYLKFNTEVRVENQMNSLEVVASYDSYLLMLDSQNYQSVEICSYLDNGDTINTQVNEFGGCYVTFINDINWNEHILSNHLVITDASGNNIEVSLDTFDFQIGNYYYFNSISYGFDLPQMNAGM